MASRHMETNFTKNIYTGKIFPGKRFNGVLLALVAVMIVGAGPANAVNFGAFADIRLEGNDQTANTGFSLGGLDLYATQQMSENTTGFIEYVFENTDAGIVTDLERLWVKQKISDKFSIGAGRFHTPLGYWNRNYHHGVMIQDTVSRPQFLEFEDGEGAILPVHVVGLLAEGEIRGGGGVFSYEASIANSSSFDSTASANASTPGTDLEIGIGNTGDETDDKSIFLRGTYAPNGTGLEFGLAVASVSYYEDAVAGDANFGSLVKGDELVSQTIIGVDARYHRGDFDFLGEFYSLDNSSDAGVGNGSDTGTAFYTQFGWRLAEQYKAVYRFESVDVNQATDTYFQLLNTQNQDNHVFALRYDVDESNALTLEIKSEDPEVGDGPTTYTLDWSFLMF